MRQATYIVCYYVVLGPGEIAVSSELPPTHSWSTALSLAKQLGLAIIRETEDTVIVYQGYYTS